MFWSFRTTKRDKIVLICTYHSLTGGGGPTLRFYPTSTVFHSWYCSSLARCHGLLAHLMKLSHCKQNFTRAFPAMTLSKCPMWQIDGFWHQLSLCLPFIWGVNYALSFGIDVYKLGALIDVNRKYNAVTEMANWHQSATTIKSQASE